jgi:hypothetical protein
MGKDQINVLTAMAAALLIVGSPAVARKPAESGGSAQVQQLLSCRSLADAAQRLACFDKEAAAIESAIARKDLVVIDKQRATAAKRSLFGFSVPDFGGLFGGGDENEIKQIEGVIAAVSRNGDGGWTIRLVDKSTWTQTDDTQLGLTPKPGDKVVVRRGAVGTFRLSVNGQPGLKVRRIG